MVLNSKNKPSTKHEKDEYDKISTYNRGYLTEFQSFIEFVFLQGCIRKRGGDIMNVRLKSIFSGETKSRRIHKT
jgi:hypothetical protein